MGLKDRLSLFSPETKQQFVIGQDMPGGGRLKQPFEPFAINDAGQFAFRATLADGSTAAYRLDTDGTLSLILKSGTNSLHGGAFWDRHTDAFDARNWFATAVTPFRLNQFGHV